MNCNFDNNNKKIIDRFFFKKPRKNGYFHLPFNLIICNIEHIIHYIIMMKGN
jgi:hypothetical protein